MIDKPFAELIHSFAAKTPTPGGGAAAAMSACLGTSLLLMAIRFSRGKKATVDHDAELQEVEERLQEALDRMLPMAERDCATFDRVSTAYTLPKETEDQQRVRERAIEEGMLGAMVVPEEVLCSVRDVLRVTTTVARLIGKNIASDLGAGAELLTAAAEGAFLNVRVNANYLKDRAKAATAFRQNEVVLTDVRDFHRTLRTTIESLLS